VKEALTFTQDLRRINEQRIASFDDKPELMMSRMELKLQEVSLTLNPKP
jgi:hypothetical protein